jgi:hypothetical protein
MNTPNAGAGTLALFPPRIPVVEQTNKGGLGVLELRKNPPENVIVTAIAAFGMLEFTTLSLYWDESLVHSFQITQEQLATGVIVFSVAPSLIPDNDNAEFYYTSHSPIGGNPDRSPSRFVRVNTRVPGAPPLFPIEPINSNLPPPSGIPNPVTDANSANGITVTIPNWVNMEVGDILTLTWGVSRVPFGRPLEQADLDHPLTIFVSQAVILANPNVLAMSVFYDIRDIVDNWSLNSLPFKTDIEAGPNTLPAPRVTEAIGDDDIALGDLGTSNAHVEIPVYTPWTAQDHVVISWLGLTAAGIRVDETVAFDMTPGDEGFTVIKEILNATVTAIAGGSAVVYYEVNGVRRSRRRLLTVSGQIPALPAPRMENLDGNGDIDPALLPPTGAVVTIAQYPGMASTDHVYLYWEGTTQTGDLTHYSDDQPVTSIGPMTFRVPVAANVTPLEGGSVRIFYTVVNGALSRSSDPLLLDVKATAPPIVIETETFTVHDSSIIGAGGVINTPFTRITQVSGNGTSGIDDAYDPVGQGADPAMFQRPVLQACINDVGANQHVQIELIKPCKAFTFNVHGANRGLATLEVRDQANGLLQSITPASGSPLNQALSYRTTGALIKYLVIIGRKDWTVWDNLKMES